jgi:hypothetical protein
MEENKPAEDAKAELLDELDVRERKYIAGRLAGLSKMQAGLEAGYTESMAANAGDKIENKDVRRGIPGTGAGGGSNQQNHGAACGRFGRDKAEAGSAQQQGH